MHTHLPSVSLFSMPFIFLNPFISHKESLIFHHFISKELMTVSQFSAWNKTEAYKYLFGLAIAEDPSASQPTYGGERGGGVLLCVVVGVGRWASQGLSPSSFSLSLYQYFLNTPCHEPPLLGILRALRAKVGLQPSPLPAACQERKSQLSEGPDKGELDSTRRSRVRMQEQWESQIESRQSKAGKAPGMCISCLPFRVPEGKKTTADFAAIMVCTQPSRRASVHA